MNNKRIKIFVSQRTDKDSYLVKNDIFQNIYCGAYEKKKFQNGIIGDNTGDNISDKKYLLSELTVQYWVWKNIDLDYYGLCHYRRFFTFLDDTDDYQNNEYGFIKQGKLNESSVNKFSICNKKQILNDIDKYDIICPKKIDIRKINTPKGLKATIKQHWNNQYNIRKLDIFTKVVNIIKQQRGKDVSSLFEEYINGYEYNGFNCFIMAKELFNRQCDFTFSVLEEVIKSIPDSKYYCENQKRLIAFIGEVLNGFTIWYFENIDHVKIRRRSIVFFETTEEQTIRFSRNAIPIVLISSDYYMPYTSVCIQSILEHINVNKKYMIIIFNKFISSNNKRLIEKMIKPFKNVSLSFFDPSYFFKDSKLFIASPVYAEEAYYRILTPWALEEFEKAIVMDTDIIVLDDLSKLYSIDIGNKCIAATIDYVYQALLNLNQNDDYEYTVKKMKMQNPYNYVNTGVMLMDLKKIRNNYSLKQMIEMSTKNNYRIQEQDVLNIVFENKIKFLSIIWNYYVEVNDGISILLNSWAPESSKNEYFQKRKKVKLVHYASQPKPWDSTSVIDAELFWDYAKRTPFYEILIQRLQEKIAYNTEIAIKNEEKGKDVNRNGLLKWIIKRKICAPEIKVKYKNNEVEVTWNPVKWANGYMVWKKIDNEWEPIISFEGLKFTDHCVFSYPKIEYGIRSYYKSNDDKVIWSDLKTIVFKCPEF